MSLERGASNPSEKRPPSRVVIEGVTPQVDCGRFPVKRTIGEPVVVEADIHTDGHDVLAAVLRYRPSDERGWHEAPMRELGNDRWRASFSIDMLVPYEYTLEAWVDRFASWRREVFKKHEAGQDLASELLEGAELVVAGARRAAGNDAEQLSEIAKQLAAGGNQAERVAVALGDELNRLMTLYPDRSGSTTFDRVLRIDVDRELARFSAWYELFPRSCSPEPGRHGTFRDVEARLHYIAEMGFDVLYLPPIHPIARTHRKGPNNTLVAGPNDPGSPWAIGSPEGGHKAVHPDLGTLEDFDRLVDAARQHGLEIALDIAFQCSPEHPYVREHPEWFRHRPDGTIKYAENPPKKYQDIYPINFDSEAWESLWQELKDVILFWIGHGVRVFRVDNPHTKPFRFWEWLIREVRAEYPETIFLSEAFTRPRVMQYLAKSGFAQSYTYFTWRNTKAELTEYLTELTQTPVREFMRPNFFANTPDILHEYLQVGGRPAFQSRLVLAATLSAAYGIYGPAYELCEGRAVKPGSEEYLDSEKYQIRQWDLDSPVSIRDLVTRMNYIRRENPALRQNWNLKFLPIDNDQMIAYCKATASLDNIILVVVNLDPHYKQSGWVSVPLEELGIEASSPFQVHDLISEARYLWNGERNYVELDPHVAPAHVFRLRRKIKTEQDFDYFM